MCLFWMRACLHRNAKRWHCCSLKTDSLRISNRLFPRRTKREEKTRTQNSHTKYKLNWWCVKNVDTIMNTHIKCKRWCANRPTLKSAMKHAHTHASCYESEYETNALLLLKKWWPEKVLVRSSIESFSVMRPLPVLCTLEHFELSLFHALWLRDAVLRMR